MNINVATLRDSSTFSCLISASQEAKLDTDGLSFNSLFLCVLCYQESLSCMSMPQTWMIQTPSMASCFIKLPFSFPWSTMSCTFKSTTKLERYRSPKKVSQGQPLTDLSQGKSCHLWRRIRSLSPPLLTLGSKELDPAKNSFYNLMVSVKDMGGQSENSFSQSTYVNITVRENIWKAPEQVEITENSTEPHPIKITQVAFR